MDEKFVIIVSVIASVIASLPAAIWLLLLESRWRRKKEGR
jgi:hypothetical protein